MDKLVVSGSLNCELNQKSHTQDGDLHLFYAVSERNCTWWGGGADGEHWGCGGNVELISSADNGVSWSCPKVPAHIPLLLYIVEVCLFSKCVCIWECI